MATYWENSCSFGLRYVSWYKYLIVTLVFSHLGFWSGNLFLIAPFPDLCLLVPFQIETNSSNMLIRYCCLYLYKNKKNLNNSTLLFLLAKVSTNLVHVRSVRLVYVKVFLACSMLKARRVSGMCLIRISSTRVTLNV